MTDSVNPFKKRVEDDARISKIRAQAFEAWWDACGPSMDPMMSQETSRMIFEAGFVLGGEAAAEDIAKQLLNSAMVAFKKLKGEK